jgi:type I restriction enzyme S subunit
MPVIKIAEIKGGISEQTKFTQQTFDESVRVRPGDLLFSWSGQPETSIDAFWWRGPEGWLNQHVFKVTPADGIDPTFFYYLLRYLKPRFVGIARNKQTTGLGHVTKRDLENMEAAYPELPEQRAIAHILGTLDDKIERNRRMSETLEAMARALFQSWFVNFDPVRAKMDGRWRKGQSLPGLPAHLYDLFPARLVDSELGEIPEGWELGTLGDVAEHLRDNETPLESPDVVFRHFSIPAFDEGQWPKCELGESIKSQKWRVPAGAILLSKLNPEIERVWLVDVQSGDRAVCSTEFLVLAPRPPHGRAYVYCAARSPGFRQELEGLVTGTSKSHQRAQVSAILGLRVVLPPDQVVSQFDRAAESLLARTLECRRESRTLAALRDALLPKLISGELRVKDAESIKEVIA